MATELLEIQPCELKFTFELKKQSSCSVQLGNKSNDHVAFKVKTTSPKKYCVRPNTGVIKPNSIYHFTVTMQAQKVAPPDLMCKDKFLIQSTVVPSGTTEDEITSETFSKDDERYIDEKKLRVSLVSPPNSPVALHRNGDSKLELSHETLVQTDYEDLGILKVVKNVDGIEQPTNDMDELRSEDGNCYDSIPTTEDLGKFNGKSNSFKEPKQSKEYEFLKLSKDINDLTSKLSFVDSKLKEAEHTIMKLTEEKNNNAIEKEKLKHELRMLKRKNNGRNVQVGFPLLYVFMVAVIGLAIGYFVHP